MVKIIEMVKSRVHFSILSLSVFLACCCVASSVLAQGTRIALVNFSSPPVYIGVDLNRDGKINKDVHQIELTNADKDAGKMHNDATTPELPYRFWVNNDLDVVNFLGNRSYGRTDCEGFNTLPVSGEYKQICEQWDEDSSGSTTNTSGSEEAISQIESDRDLEDFVPVIFYISTAISLEEYTITLRANGVDVNLFKSDWDDEGTNVANQYIFDEAVTKSQIALANGEDGHFPTVLRSGTEVDINQNLLDDYFDPETGEARFILEALKPNACGDNAENCYLELEIIREKDETFIPLISRLYLDLHDVKDFYRHDTAGSAEGAFGFDFDAEYFDGISQEDAIRMDIYRGLVSPQVINEALRKN